MNKVMKTLKSKRFKVTFSCSVSRYKVYYLINAIIAIVTLFWKTLTMAGMEHIISMEEMISRTVERKEAGETSRGHDQPVIVSSATQKLSIAIHETGCTRSEEENFMKLKEARLKGINRWTTKPKIQKVMFVHLIKI